jgi:hypothetical protein
MNIKDKPNKNNPNEAIMSSQASQTKLNLAMRFLEHL